MKGSFEIGKVILVHYFQFRQFEGLWGYVVFVLVDLCLLYGLIREFP